MTIRHAILLAPLLLTWIGPAASQSVYKSMDDQGRVTYSSTPPANVGEKAVKRVEITPPPTEQERQAAMQRAKALQSLTEQARQEQAKDAAEAAVSKAEARKALTEARTALDEAKVKGDDDWQYLATGGRVLKQEYLDRVEEAKEMVEQAKKEMNNAGSTQR